MLKKFQAFPHPALSKTLTPTLSRRERENRAGRRRLLTWERIDPVAATGGLV